MKVPVYLFLCALRSSHSLCRSFPYLDIWGSDANDQHTTQCCKAVWDYLELVTIQNIFMASLRIPRAVIRV